MLALLPTEEESTKETILKHDKHCLKERIFSGISTTPRSLFPRPCQHEIIWILIYSFDISESHHVPERHYTYRHGAQLMYMNKGVY